MTNTKSFKGKYYWKVFLIFNKTPEVWATTPMGDIYKQLRQKICTLDVNQF